MKLLYIYFDFTQNGKNPDGYRGYKICELNFGTQTQYHMESPTKGRLSYLLISKKRSDTESIEPGFWGNERIYNVSALVGDNGSGKSMLMHEIIRCMMTSFHEHMTFEKLVEPQYPFVFITESANGEISLVNFHISPEVSGFPEGWKRISLPIDQTYGRAITLNWGLNPYRSRKEYGVLRQTKMIYFSNAITMADKIQNDYWNYYEVANSKGYSINSQYSSPMYDCSLITDMSEAVKTSRAKLNSFAGHLETYFNFRSYQEARYVFDRNQRKILLELRDKHHLPVPLPRLLKLTILNAFLSNNIDCSQPNDKLDNLLINYYNNDYFDSNALRTVASLSMNCILAFCASENIEFLENISSQFISKIDYSKKYDLFSELLTYIRVTSEKKASEYFKLCQRYLLFLWKNVVLIDRYFKFHSTDLNKEGNITIEIPLGDEIDTQLEEFMIRFINLTRAVSKHQYFLVFNWGLSSGESNLLHMFTKLRYALSGNVFDTEKYDEINAEIAEKKADHIKREEKLLTTTDNKTMHDCDSVILFIDEADLTYHPEWQRQFITIITEFLPKLYTDPYYTDSGSGCKEIQIILSTHSPLMLGDFPSASVTYLRKDNNGTNYIDDCEHPIIFGENLYTILRDSFYLKNGTIGEFARRKIEQILIDTTTIRDEAESEQAFQSWTDEMINQKLDCLSSHEKRTVRYLAQGIIRNKLEEEINICRRLLHCAIDTDMPRSENTSDYQARIRQLEREKTILEERINALKRKSEVSE